MQTPHLYYVGELVRWINETAQRDPKKPRLGYHPTRPIGFQGIALGRRLKLAWGVLTGKYDAVYWEPKLRDALWNVDLTTAKAVTTATNAATSATNALAAVPVVDQGELNASTACAVTSALAMTTLDMGAAAALPYVYHNERVVDERHHA
jgi:hypothetical protein